MCTYTNHSTVILWCFPCLNCPFLHFQSRSRFAQCVLLLFGLGLGFFTYWKAWILRCTLVRNLSRGMYFIASFDNSLCYFNSKFCDCLWQLCPQPRTPPCWNFALNCNTRRKLNFVQGFENDTLQINQIESLWFLKGRCS